VLIMPNIDAANIAYQMIKVLGDALPVGPILIGAARPAHILTPSTTARGCREHDRGGGGSRRNRPRKANFPSVGRAACKAFNRCCG